jgi:hypothetical protein
LGACAAAPLTFAQVGPKVRFAINSIDVVPGSAGKHVVAVGNGGRVAAWNENRWTELTTPSTVNLNKVAFLSNQLAFIGGRSNTLWSYRPSTGRLQPESVPSAGNLVAISGRSDGDVLVADDEGGLLRLSGSTWSPIRLPEAFGPYSMASAYLDETGRERISGICGSSGSRRGCVAYRFPAGIDPNWVVHETNDATEVSSVGPSFEPPDGVNSHAYVGSALGRLLHHTNPTFGSMGGFDVPAVTPSLVVGRIVGITPQVGRQTIYLLTSATRTSTTTSDGRLFALSNAGDTLRSEALVSTFAGEAALSAHEASGVVLADVDRLKNANTVFRRSRTVFEAMDIGDELVGVTTDTAGSEIYASSRGTLFRRTGESSFDVAQVSDGATIAGLEAQNGEGVLLVGSDTSSNGVIYRHVRGSGFERMASIPNVKLKSVCRFSPSEAWVVGTRGTIVKITGANTGPVESGTTEDLHSVDCGSDIPVACGDNSVVLGYIQGIWQPLLPRFPAMGHALTSCRKAGPTVYVGGSDAFWKYENRKWTKLPAVQGLKNFLALRGTRELYGSTSANGRGEVVHFDGSNWGSALLQSSGLINGGVQIGSRVVFAGAAGTIVEGR